MAKQSVQVGLLRGINVAGQKKVPMADLRELVSSIGFTEVQTYIQSGNLLFRSSLSDAKASTALENAVAKHFGFDVEVVVIAAAQWLRYAKASPFPDAEEARPKTLLLGVSKDGPQKDALETIQKYVEEERVLVQGKAIWIDFVNGSGRSKIRPAVLQRALGSSATTRNWRTVQKLAEMIRALSPR